MNERISGDCPYRSPKAAAREEAVLLKMGHAPRNLEASSVYDADKHIQYPRMIELKPSRFAETAVLIDDLAERVFEGKGDNIRLPALQKLRDRPEKIYMNEREYNPLLQLSQDWSDMDLSAEINDVLADPKNQERISAYEEMTLDIATDPNAIESAFDSETVQEELTNRIDLSNSFETEVSGRLLVKWGLENLPSRDMAKDEKRLFIISLIPFFEKISELEIEHLHRYYFGKWNDLYIDNKQAGVAFTRNHVGEHILKITEPEKRPERTSGRPVGCPAGFTFEDVAIAGLETAPPPGPTVIARSLTAFVNEAYDRGVLDELYNNKRRKT